MQLENITDIYGHSIDKSWIPEPGLLVDTPKGLIEAGLIRIHWLFTGDSSGTGDVTITAPVNGKVRRPEYFKSFFGAGTWSEEAPEWLKAMIEATRTEAHEGTAAQDVEAMKLVNSGRMRWMNRRADVTGSGPLHFERSSGVKTLTPVQVMFDHKIRAWEDTEEGGARLWGDGKEFIMLKSPAHGQLPDEFMAAYLQAYTDLEAAPVPPGWVNHRPAAA